MVLLHWSRVLSSRVRTLLGYSFNRGFLRLRCERMNTSHSTSIHGKCAHLSNWYSSLFIFDIFYWVVSSLGGLRPSPLLPERRPRSSRSCRDDVDWGVKVGGRGPLPFDDKKNLRLKHHKQHGGALWSRRPFWDIYWLYTSGATVPVRGSSLSRHNKEKDLVLATPAVSHRSQVLSATAV